MFKISDGFMHFDSAIKYQSKFIYLSLVLTVISGFFWALYYSGIRFGNSPAWVTWILSIFFLLTAYLPGRLFAGGFIKVKAKRSFFLVLIISAVYFISHLWNFSQAPWNRNGLFDDAAWDIYFAKNHILNGVPLQPAYFDEVGYISREVVFHYYITVFFRLFGYNLLVFNLSLLLLGFITVLFTTLIADRIFGNKYVTLITLFLINFFPLHYTHIFMGHRYAIAAPLMTASLYYLLTGIKRKSGLRVIASAFLAAACWDSAIMGKQYIMALGASLTATFIFARSYLYTPVNKKLVAVWIAAFLISASPLIFYIFFNYKQYNLREQNLIGEFITDFRSGGFGGLKPYTDRMRELFFAELTFSRQFLPDFPIIPIPYYFLLFPGLVIAFLRKRFEIVFISIIPVLATFVSGPYDFRVLLAVPAWILAISLLLNEFLIPEKIKNNITGKISAGLIMLIIFSGLLPAVDYLWKVSRDTDHLYLLPHKDVGVSRFVQDIASGSKSSSAAMKKNELKRTDAKANPEYDTFFCPYSSYAIAHLYLQDFDDKKVLSLCDQGIQLLKTPEEIRLDGKKAIAGYFPQGRDLLLIWEVSDKSKNAIEYFSGFSQYGTGYNYSDTTDGITFYLYALRINAADITEFKNELLSDKP